MALNHNAVGLEIEPVEVSWTGNDSMLYALAVGAGHEDPTQELEFTIGNRLGLPARVLPTFGATIAFNGTRPAIGDVPPERVLHHSHSLTLHRPIPPSGRARVITRVSELHDHGWGALAVSESGLFDDQSGDLLLTSRMSVFLKGEGRFGGQQAPRVTWDLPDRPPDVDVAVRTRPEQALLYSLCGDKSPVHIDPAFAARCGFSSPILHGLCTYGITGRILLHRMCDSDPSRFRAMSAQFRRRVVPGEELRVQAWRVGEECRFRTLNAHGGVVLDAGILTTLVPDAV
jgi:acyl dehydratase